MKYDYEKLTTDEPLDETHSILLIGKEGVGKKTLLKTLQQTQKDELFSVQNYADLSNQQFIQALENCDQILLIFNKHNLESLEKLSEFIPKIQRYASNAKLTLVENQDDKIGAIRGIDKHPSFTGITRFVTVDEEDIQQFLQKQSLTGVQCITVSATEQKNIQTLWNHIKTLSMQNQFDAPDFETSSESEEDSPLMALTDEHSLLDRIDRFITEYNSEQAQIAHKINKDQLGRINSIGIILTAGVLSKNPVEFFKRTTVERTLNEHLRALRYATPLSSQAVSNLVKDTLQSIHSSLPKQFPYVNYLLQGNENASLFHKRNPNEAASKLIDEVKTNVHHIKKK